MSKEWEFWWTFFNKISREKVYCKESKMAVVCPIYKNKGKAREPSNYTAVSLLRAVGKFFFPQYFGLCTEFNE